MRSVVRPISLFLVYLSSCALLSQDLNSPVKREILELRTLPTPQWEAATAKILKEVRAMEAGPTKLFLAFGLTQVVDESSVSRGTLRAIAETYHQALIESPPADAAERSSQYEYLATFIHYQHVEVDFQDAELAKAQAVLAADDADVRKADFTLSDMKGNTVTLSRLRGKIVLVNFWATWCVPCLAEMHDLDAIQKRYGSQQVAVVSLTSDERQKIETLLEREHYQQQILLDSDGTIYKKFHVSEIPHLFVFDRNGRFEVDYLGRHSQAELIEMLHRPGLLSEAKQGIGESMPSMR